MSQTIFWAYLGKFSLHSRKCFCRGVFSGPGSLTDLCSCDSYVPCSVQSSSTTSEFSILLVPFWPPRACPCPFSRVVWLMPPIQERLDKIFFTGLEELRPARVGWNPFTLLPHLSTLLVGRLGADFSLVLTRDYVFRAFGRTIVPEFNLYTALIQPNTAEIPSLFSPILRSLVISRQSRLSRPSQNVFLANWSD